MPLRALVLLAFAAPALAAPPSHCGARETVVFTCPVKARVLSVCAGAPAGDLSYAQYHFGPLGEAGLVFPSDAQGFAAFRLKETTQAQGSSTTLSFVRGDVGYEVWSQDGRDAGGGVNIYKGGQRIATVGCSGAPTQSWQTLAGHVAQGAIQDLSGPASCDAAASRFADHAFAQANGQMDGVQQAEIWESAKAQCAAGWPAAAVDCFAKAASASACLGKLRAPQRAALESAVKAATPE